MSQKLKITIIALALMFVGLIVIAIIESASDTPNQKASNNLPKAMGNAQVLQVQVNDIKSTGEGEYFNVIKVIDGDTITVNINGKTTTLRLIGINTPETVDPRKPVECFGREASAKAHELLDGKRVRLEYDPSQGMFD